MTYDDRCRAPSAEVIRHGCRQAIADYGWHCVGVFADPAAAVPPYAYTVGLAAPSRPSPHPELVVAGLSPPAGRGVLSAAVELIRNGAKLAGGDERDGIIARFAVRFRAIDLGACALSFDVSDDYYGCGSEVPRLQLIWPDREGRFPGDPDVDPRVMRIQDIGG